VVPAMPFQAGVFPDGLEFVFESQERKAQESLTQPWPALELVAFCEEV